MGNMNLVTGYAGKEHVTAADQGALYAALVGNGNYVLDLGEKFAATKLSDNSVRIASGEALLQGRHCRIDNGLYIDQAVESGTAGYLRNDLVCIRYTVDENTGVEDANLVIVRGTPVAASPADPAHTAGDILGGGKLAEFPIYRLRLNGITLEAIEPLFEGKVLTIEALLNALNALKTETAQCFESVDEEFASLRAEIASYPYTKMKVGTYTGTGTYGASNPTKITVNFTPKVLFVVGSYGTSNGIHFVQADTGITPIYYTANMTLFRTASGSANGHITWAANSISWYHESIADRQQNEKSKKYFYVVLGE